VTNPLGRRHVTRAVAGLIVLSAAILIALVLTPQDTAGPCRVVSGPTSVKDLPESSGLAVSRRHAGVLWSHNDSGNAEVLFALDTTGHVRGRIRVPVRMRDWEDISAGRCAAGPCLYLADIGDNSRERRRVQIHRLPEPALEDLETARPETYTAVYVDGPHNAEAMFVIGEEVFVITRDRTGTVYRATIRPDSRDLTLERFVPLGLESVTDAEASPDETVVVVRTSDEAVWYRTADLVRGERVPYARVPIARLREAQGEGVAIDGPMLYLSSEGAPWSGGGTVMSLRCVFTQP
jgi:hypothetical protein